jgi:hypothetical protein
VGESIEDDLNAIRAQLAKLLKSAEDWWSDLDMKQPHQIRWNVENQRLVVLLHSKELLADSWEESGRVQHLWRVRDLIEPFHYDLKVRSIGAQVAEMEAIAWAAK